MSGPAHGHRAGAGSTTGRLGDPPTRAVVLLGDSHLARMAKPQISALEALLPGGWQVHNCAAAGSDSSDLHQRCWLPAHLPAAAFVVSVGTNDAAPWKQVPPRSYTAHLTAVLDVLGPDRTVLVGAPPVDEARQRPGRARTNAVVAAYAAASQRVATSAGACFVDTARALAPSLSAGEAVHSDDGVHLSATGYGLLLPALATALITVPLREAPALCQDEYQSGVRPLGGTGSGDG